MQFVFKDSFHEMLADFSHHQPQILIGGKKVPYDWTIYYLRKKALTQRITKEELSWILLQFNQKRGYYQLRGELEEEKDNENIEIISAKVESVERKEKDKKYDKYWYEMHLDNGMVYRASFYNDVSAWKGETKDFVLKTTILKDNSLKHELSFLPTTDEIERMDAQRKAKCMLRLKCVQRKTSRAAKRLLVATSTTACFKSPTRKSSGNLSALLKESSTKRN